jgi:ribonuclease-3
VARRTEPPRPPYDELRERLGVGLPDHVLDTVMTHRSFAFENGGIEPNERLEFLGDAVLGIVVTERLYLAHPTLPEGQLARLRAAVVNASALAGVARGLGLGDWLRLGRGEETTGGRDKSSILADTTEALLGAVFLEHGLDVARALVRRLFDPLMVAAARQGAALDWKTSLQELAAARGMGAPEYVVAESGPDHRKFFTADVRLSGVAFGSGSGTSKKVAEQHAAEAAYAALAASSPAGAAGSAVPVGAAAAASAEPGATGNVAATTATANRDDAGSENTNPLGASPADPSLDTAGSDGASPGRAGSVDSAEGASAATAG